MQQALVQYLMLFIFESVSYWLEVKRTKKALILLPLAGVINDSGFIKLNNNECEDSR